MIDKIKEYVEQQHMLQTGDSVVMGISGGADSVAMLLAFSMLQKEYDLSLYAVHINHGIRKEASLDADYVKELCDTYGIPFYLYTADVESMAREQKKTVEEMGREYRYQCFGEVMDRVGACTLATAHHRGDQAETILFRMIRGTDLPGLAGIRPVAERDTDFGRVRIIRPLLSCAKAELTSWLTAQGVSWCEDATNQDNIYVRNRLRNEVLPVLAEINSGAEEHIADLTGIMWEYETYFQKVVLEYTAAFVYCKEEREYHTDRAKLLQQEKVLAKAVIYEMLAMAGKEKKDFTKEHILSVYQLLTNQSGKKLILPHGIEALISYENLIIRKCFRGTDASYLETEISLEELSCLPEGEGRTVILPGGEELYFEHLCLETMTDVEREKLLNHARNSKNNYTKFFDCDTMKDALCVRKTKQDDFFVMNEMGNKKKLSRHFMDIRLPADKRNDVVVLAIGNEVLWLVGGRRCERFKIGEDTHNILKVAYKGEKRDGSD